MSQLHESPSDNPSETTTCYHCKCANAAKVADLCNPKKPIDPDICYAEQSVEDHSLNTSGSNRIASDAVYRNLYPPKHVGGTQVAPIVTARHVDIMRAKLSGRFDKNKKSGTCKRVSGTSED